MEVSHCGNAAQRWPERYFTSFSHFHNSPQWHIRYDVNYSFDGTDKDYIRFLEARLESLEKQVKPTQHPQSSKTRHRRPVIQPKPFVPVPQHHERAQQQRNGRTFSKRLDEHIRSFLSPLPASSIELQQRRQRTSHNTPEQVLETFRILTRLSNHVGSTTITPRPFLILSAADILDDYCQFTSHLKHGAEQQAQLHRFATLLFLCVCCVSREAKVPVDCIDNRMKAHFAKSTYTSKYCKELRTASKWCAQLMEKLEVSIGPCGPELLLLCRYAKPPDLSGNRVLLSRRSRYRSISQTVGVT